MKKLFLISVMLLFSLSLFSQSNYTLTHHTFNAAGGYQSNGTYSVTTAFAEKFQGKVENTSYEGFLGFLFPQLDIRAPLITSIDDVPNDQGHQVQIVWNKCGYDDIYAIDTYYSIWRWDEDFKGMTGGSKESLRMVNNPATLRMVNPLLRGVDSDSSEDGVCNIPPSQNYGVTGRKGFGDNKSTLRMVNSPSTLRMVSNIRKGYTYTEPWEVVEQFREDPDKTYFWQKDGEVWTFIAEVPALQYDEYSYIAPTLADSNAVDINYSTFKVVYHDLYEYYESVQDSGYSVDNIPPDETKAYIAKNDNNMIISWNEVTTGTYLGNSYEELNGVWYKLYASDTPDFVCDETTYLETVIDLDYDHLLTGEDKKFFKIVVSDEPPVD